MPFSKITPQKGHIEIKLSNFNKVTNDKEPGEFIGVSKKSISQPPSLSSSPDIDVTTATSGCDAVRSLKNPYEYHIKTAMSNSSSSNSAKSSSFISSTLSSSSSSSSSSAPNSAQSSPTSSSSHYSPSLKSSQMSNKKTANIMPAPGSHHKRKSTSSDTMMNTTAISGRSKCAAESSSRSAKHAVHNNQHEYDYAGKKQIK